MLTTVREPFQRSPPAVLSAWPEARAGRLASKAIKARTSALPGKSTMTSRKNQSFNGQPRVHIGSSDWISWMATPLATLSQKLMAPKTKAQLFWSNRRLSLCIIRVTLKETQFLISVRLVNYNANLNYSVTTKYSQGCCEIRTRDSVCNLEIEAMI